MDLQVIRHEQVPLGKPLPCNIYDRGGKLLLKAGEVVHSHRQLEELRVDGLFIPKREKNEAPPVEVKESPFALLDRLPPQMERLFGRMTVEPNFAGRTHTIAKAVQEACAMDRDACLAWLFLETEARYVISHPLRTAILCELIGLQLAWSDEVRMSSLSASLTMNIAKLVLQHKLQLQTEAISPAQFTLLREHCTAGAEMLRNMGVVDAIWLNAVAQHHERADGSGYPQALKAETISREAKLLAVADSYAAMIVDHAYRRAAPGNGALKEIYLQRGKKMDAEMADTLVKVVGVFPPGSYVRLANGEVAVVTRPGATPTTPAVVSFVNPRGLSMNPGTKRDCTQVQFAIKEALIKSKVDASLNNKAMFWGYKN